MESLHHAEQQQTSTYLNAFEKTSVLMPSPATVFAEKDQAVLPNLILMHDIKQRGRPRKLRIKSAMAQTCSDLGGKGPENPGKEPGKLITRTEHVRNVPSTSKKFDS